MRRSMNSSLESLLTDFSAYLSTCVTENKKSQINNKSQLKSKSQKSYVSYVKTLDKANNGKTMEWLKAAISVKDDPIGRLSELFDSYFAEKGIVAQPQWKTGLCRLGEYVCGFTNAGANIHSIKKFDLMACQLVAQSAIFCPKEIFHEVQTGDEGAKVNREDKKKEGYDNRYGSWFHYRFKRVSGKGQTRGDFVKSDYIDGPVRLDDNNQAKNAIKYAVLKGLRKKYGLDGTPQLFKGFEACHIWAKCDDERYHTSVANIVLLPREIAGLTDHCEAVKELLKYEAWKRFSFKPEDEATPQKPQYYNEVTWRTTPEMYKIGKYICIYHSDESGQIGSVYMAEAQLMQKVTENKPLKIRTVEPAPKDVELGTVTSVSNYKTNESICVKTEQGWWHIERNENLETLLGGPLEWGD